MTYLLIGLGLLPWRIHRQRAQTGLCWRIDALFWALRVERRGRRVSWRLTLPAVRRLADAVWAALRSLL